MARLNRNGVLAALFAPGAYTLTIALLFSWRDAMPSATTFQQALLQGAFYIIPFSIMGALLGSPIILPALFVWAFLERRGWTGVTAFGLVGLFFGIAAGLSFALIGPTAPTSSTWHWSQAQVFVFITPIVSGSLTGVTVWMTRRNAMAKP